MFTKSKIYENNEKYLKFIKINEILDTQIFTKLNTFLKKIFNLEKNINKNLSPFFLLNICTNHVATLCPCKSQRNSQLSNI